jgi:hypothetical protein
LARSHFEQVRHAVNVLIWPGLAVIVTVAMMAFERRSNPRQESSTTSTPVHYGHSDVADHEYEDLPRASSGAVQSDAGEPGAPWRSQQSVNCNAHVDEQAPERSILL